MFLTERDIQKVPKADLLQFFRDNPTQSKDAVIEMLRKHGVLNSRPELGEAKIRNLPLENIITFFGDNEIQFRMIVSQMLRKAFDKTVRFSTVRFPDRAMIHVVDYGKGFSVDEDPDEEELLPLLNTKNIKRQINQSGNQLKRGDLIAPKSDLYRNDNIFIYDGKKFILLNYEVDDYGSVPAQFKAVSEFPIDYWVNRIDHNYHINADPKKFKFGRVQNLGKGKYSSFHQIPATYKGKRVNFLIENQEIVNKMTKTEFLKILYSRDTIFNARPTIEYDKKPDTIYIEV